MNNFYLIDEMDEDLTYAPSTVEILEISKRTDKTKSIKWCGATIVEIRSCFIKFGRKWFTHPAYDRGFGTFPEINNNNK